MNRARHDRIFSPGPVARVPSPHRRNRLAPIQEVKCGGERECIGARSDTRDRALGGVLVGVLSRFPDVTFELQSSFATGARGSAEWIMLGARDLPGMPDAGRRIEVRGASIFEFVGEKIRLFRLLGHGHCTSSNWRSRSVDVGETSPRRPSRPHLRGCGAPEYLA